MGFLKSFKKKKKEKDRAAEGGKASKKDQKPPRSPQLEKTTNAEPELARPAVAGNDAPTIVSSAHTSAENLPDMANPKHHDNDHPDNGGGMASAQSTVTIRAASDASDESRPTAAAAPTPLIANNGPTLNKPSLRRSKSIVEFDKSEHKVLVPIETQLGKPIEKVYDGVHDGPELGTGITGVVRKVTHKKTQHEYAVKKLDLGKINDHPDNGGGMASAQSTVTIRAASDASDESRPTAAAAPTPLIANNGPTLNKPSLRRSKSIVEFDKSEHKVLVPIETQLGKPIEKVYDGVHDGPELGTGITGVVRKVTHKKTQHEYAVKKLDLGKIKTEAELKQLREEVSYILTYICGGWVQIVRPCWAANASCARCSRPLPHTMILFCIDSPFRLPSCANWTIPTSSGSRRCTKVRRPSTSFRSCVWGATSSTVSMRRRTFTIY